MAMLIFGQATGRDCGIQSSAHSVDQSRFPAENSSERVVSDVVLPVGGCASTTRA